MHAAGRPWVDSAGRATWKKGFGSGEWNWPQQRDWGSFFSFSLSLLLLFPFGRERDCETNQLSWSDSCSDVKPSGIMLSHDCVR